METIEQLRQQYFEEINEEWSRGAGIPTATYFRWLENKVIETSKYNRMTSNIDVSRSINNHEGMTTIGHVSRGVELREAIEMLQETNRGIIIIDSAAREERDNFEQSFSGEGLIKSFEVESINPINWDEKHFFQEDKVPSPIYHPKRKKFKRK